MKSLDPKFILGLPRGLAHKIRRWIFIFKPGKAQFREIYLKGGFGGSESLSGVGSDLSQTEVIRARISQILRRFEIQSMLDIPCGDMFWMQHVDLGRVHYIGADIVDELVQINLIRFGHSEKTFLVRDLTKDPLPRVDLVFCRDCLVHLKLCDALLATRNIKRSGSQYLFTTTHVCCTSNEGLGLNFFRPLNLQLPPFSFPAPIELVQDGPFGGPPSPSGKRMALWRIADLP